MEETPALKPKTIICPECHQRIVAAQVEKHITYHWPVAPNINDATTQKARDHIAKLRAAAVEDK